jgi:hypothetical protein
MQCRQLVIASWGVLLASAAQAQWRLDGFPASVVPYSQEAPVIASDGAGGAIMAWVDFRNGLTDIYAQRMSPAGIPLWAADGVAVCAAGGDQYSPVITTDEAGGVVVAWYDFRNGNTDIFAQRLNGAGAPLWTVNGVGLCTDGSNQFSPVIVADGNGGVIAAWVDTRTDISGDVYAQRVNASGLPQWTANGVPLCVSGMEQSALVIATDGAGGAIVSWQDWRAFDYDVYAQRVNSAGATQWAANGIAVLAFFSDQRAPAIVSDGAGGAIIAWEDARLVGNVDIYAQRVNGAGATLWPGAGIAACVALRTQAYIEMASDGAGGAILTWEDFRSSSTYDVYAQRIAAAGVPVWTANGVPVCTEPLWTQYSPSIASDGAGGAVIAWPDGRNGNIDDVYAQRVSGAGVPMWTADGVAVCNAAGNQFYPVVASDGVGGVIVAWYDYRSGAGAEVYAQHADIYAQRVEGRYGFWGRPEPTLATVTDVPGDQGGKVKVAWIASGRDELNQQVISHYSIWRTTDPPPALNALVSLSQVGADFSGSAIRVERTPTADYFWELVATQSAVYLPSYAYSAPTSYDSTATSSATHQFQVVAHAYFNQYLNWSSNVVGGHSVDNLAPLAPFLLTAQRVGVDVQLNWNRAVAPDLRDYAIYRATASGVTPAPIHFLTSAEDTLAVDANAPSSALYYIVTAFDVHANQSSPSNEASVGALTDAGKTPALTALTVLQNHPNPFNATTEFDVGLPSASSIRIEVFDVSGRKVSAMQVSGMKGWQRVSFAGRDEGGRSLASGVYFCRIHAAGSTVTKKMVIAR